MYGHVDVPLRGHIPCTNFARWKPAGIAYARMLLQKPRLLLAAVCPPSCLPHGRCDAVAVMAPIIACLLGLWLMFPCPWLEEVSWRANQRSAWMG